MIEQGGMTIIKDKQGQPQTYRCVRIEDGNAVLRNVLTDGAGGKPKIIPVKDCPYVKDNQLIIPEKEEYNRPKPKTTINLSKIIKDNTIINNNMMLPTLNKLNVINDLMLVFKQDNNNFNSSKFIDACSVVDD